MTLDFSFTEDRGGPYASDPEKESINLDDDRKEPKPDPAPDVVPVQYDLDAVRKLFKSYDPEFKEIEKKANALKVTDDDSAATATEMIAQASGLVKKIEGKRKEKIKDPDSFVRSVNSIVRPVRLKVEGITKSVKKKIGDYEYQKILKQREDEKKIKEAAAKAQAELDKQAKEKGVESVKLPEMKVPKKKDPIRTEVGTASTRMVWDFEIEDAEKVPDNYKVIDEKKIKNAIAAGIRDIPGVKIVERPSVSVRTN